MLALADEARPAIREAVLAAMMSWRKGWTQKDIADLLLVSPGSLTDAMDPDRPGHGVLSAKSSLDDVSRISQVLLRVLAAGGEDLVGGLAAQLHPSAAAAIYGAEPRRMIGVLLDAGVIGENERSMAFGILDFNRGVLTQSQLLATARHYGFSVTVIDSAVRGVFNVRNPRAVALAERMAAQLVTAINNSQREALRSLVSRALAGETFGGRWPATVRDLAREVQRVVGLAPRQMSAVMRLSETLNAAAAGDRAAISGALRYAGVTGVREGMSPAAINSVLDKYADRALAYRADLIAHTESVRAVNMGRLEGWREGVRSGLLPSGWVEWIVNPDDALCAECDSMANSAYEVDVGDGPRGAIAILAEQTDPESFRSADGSETESPPLHPDCRCTLVFHSDFLDRPVGPNTVITPPPPSSSTLSGIAQSLSPPSKTPGTTAAHVQMNTQARHVLDTDQGRGIDWGETTAAKSDVTTAMTARLEQTLDPEDWDELFAAYGEEGLYQGNYELKRALELVNRTREEGPSFVYGRGGPVTDDVIRGAVGGGGDRMPVADLLWRFDADDTARLVLRQVDLERLGVGRIGSPYVDDAFRVIDLDDLDDLMRALNTDVRFHRVDDPLDRLLRALSEDVSDFGVVGDPPTGQFRDLFVATGRHATVQRSLREQVVRALVHNWADTSGDHHAMSLLLQRFAQEEFGLAAAANPFTVHDAAGVARALTAFLADHPRLENAMRGYLREMYANTQDDLARRGITELFLGRGTSVRELPVQGAASAFTSNPLSSWSTDMNLAMDWGQASVWTRVPASRVFSTPRTGLGCLNESELVLLGPSARPDVGWVLHH